jgi:antitoxin component YwqK of YwqJK toxin-antitoxin module
MKKTALPLLLILLFIVSSSVAQEVTLKKGKYISRENGKPFTGIFTENDPSTGKVISETNLKNGLLDGTTTIYYPSGQKKEVRNYREGKKHGTWSTWNESGIQTALATFLDGKKDGEWVIWDDQGIKRYEMFYTQGEKSGTWIFRDETGKETSRQTYDIK